MALAATEDDVVDFLNGTGSLVDGTNLFRGPVRPADRVPDGTVFVMETSGEQPRHYRASTEVHYPGLQVRVRSAKEQFEAGVTLARLVLETLHRATIAGYLMLEAVTSRPNPLGRDEEGRWEWSINFKATIDE